MSANTKIEWTDETWNPITGCSRISPGCENCYAERLAGGRLRNTPRYKDTATKTPSGPRWNGKLLFHEDVLRQPLRWTKPRLVFVNSMSDLFHESLTNEQIAAIFGVMSLAPTHTFQVLTKRAKRMREWFEWIGYLHGPGGERRECDPVAGVRICANRYGARPPMPHRAGEIPYRWPLPNVWLGVSVEDQKRAAERIPHLLRTPAAVRFLSCEPLLGHVDLGCVGGPNDDPDDISDGIDSLRWHAGGVDWVIVGGESGPGARPMHRGWAQSIRDQCVRADVAYFHKQNGEFLPLSEAKLKLGELRRGDCGEIAVDTEGREYPGRYIRVGKKLAGRMLDGRTWDQMPAPAGAVA